jgi:phospholipase D
MSAAEIFAGAVGVAAIAAIAFAASPDPMVPVTTDLSIETCFAPEGQCAAMAIREINEAEHRILVNAYALTGGAGFAEALVRAKQRGVEVEVIADRGVPCERHSGVPMLVEAAIPVWIDQRVRLAHAKVMIIDDQTVIAGSYNFTVQASLNSEDLIIIRSTVVSARFSMHWKLRRDQSSPYVVREDWCAGRAELFR